MLKLYQILHLFSKTTVDSQVDVGDNAEDGGSDPFTKMHRVLIGRL